MQLTLQKSGQIVEQLQNIVSVHTVKLPQRTVIMLKNTETLKIFMMIIITILTATRMQKIIMTTMIDIILCKKNKN